MFYWSRQQRCPLLACKCQVWRSRTSQVFVGIIKLSYHIRLPSWTLEAVFIFFSSPFNDGVRSARVVQTTRALHRPRIPHGIWLSLIFPREPSCLRYQHGHVQVLSGSAPALPRTTRISFSISTSSLHRVLRDCASISKPLMIHYTRVIFYSSSSV